MIATTRAALLRGVTTIDALGDEIEDNGVPAPVLAWAETRRNFAKNPKAASALTGWSQSGFSLSRVVGTLGESETYVRGLRTSSGASRISYAPGVDMPTAGETITVRAHLRSSHAITLNVSARGNVASATGALPLGGVIAVPIGESIIEVTGSTVVATATASSGVAFTSGSGSVGSTLDVTMLDIEIASDIADYLDGDGGSDDEKRDSWLGLPSASVSIRETSTIVDPGGWGDFAISILEGPSREFDEASSTWRTIEELVARVDFDLPVDDGDRIRDNRDGTIYAVDSIKRTPRGLSGRSSVTMKLRRTAP